MFSDSTASMTFYLGCSMNIFQRFIPAICEKNHVFYKAFAIWLVSCSASCSSWSRRTFERANLTSDTIIISATAAGKRLSWRCVFGFAAERRETEYAPYRLPGREGWVSTDCIRKYTPPTLIRWEIYLLYSLNRFQGSGIITSLVRCKYNLTSKPFRPSFIPCCSHLQYLIACSM